MHDTIKYSENGRDLPGHLVSLGGDPIPSNIWELPIDTVSKSSEEVAEKNIATLREAARLMVETNVLGLH